MYKKASGFKYFFYAHKTPLMLSYIACLALPIVLSGCAKNTQDLAKIKDQKKLFTELNRRNNVGFIEFCARKGYTEHKPIASQKARFDSEFDADTMKLLHAAYQHGKNGQLLLFIQKKKKNKGTTEDTSSENETSEMFTQKVRKTTKDTFVANYVFATQGKIQVRFSASEDRNGELAVYCQRQAKYASEGLGIFSQKKEKEEPIEKDYHGYQNRR